MQFRLAGIVNDSIVDGPGLRLAIFFQGCPYGCPGCHNPDSHDPAGGQPAETEDICRMIDKNPLLSGITLSGGEPLMQPEAALALAQYARQKGLGVWLYSGGLFEEIVSREDQAIGRLLPLIDVMVDGPFRLAERSLDLRFRGSRNQRLIDVPKSLKEGKAVLWEPES